MKDIQSCQTRRNELVHSAWAAPPTSDAVFTARSRARERYMYRPTERAVAELDQLATDIDLARRRVVAIVNEWPMTY
jgi:hypothetical protein